MIKTEELIARKVFVRCSTHVVLSLTPDYVQLQFNTYMSNCSELADKDRRLLHGRFPYDDVKFNSYM